ncbi:Uncharacterised protein [uncultured archaeon]|nr:Uncharacterised protein [uncultured archaeon]
MRKIIPKTEEQKKKNKNQWMVGGVLIFVMVFSVLGYSLNNQPNNANTQVSYNGFKFTQSSGLWHLQKGNFNFSFVYNPQEVSATNSILNPLENYTGKPLYIYSDSQEAATDIYRNLFYNTGIVQRVQDACFVGKNCSAEIPIKTCDNNFIIIQEGNETQIKQQGNCVFIEGKMENLTQISDSFLYKLIGIQ